MERRVADGTLRPLHRGVYLAAPGLSGRGEALAAALACGPHAVVSHRSAANLWGLLPADPQTRPVDVSVANSDRRRPDIKIHRVVALPPAQVTKLDGIPITTVARTVFDAGIDAQPKELACMVSEALARRLTTRAALLELLRRRVRQPGARALRELLAPGRTSFTRSEAEKQFRELVRKAALPTPEINVELHGYEVDFFWRDEGLVIEIDGFATHALPDRFERDRLRDGTLAAAGIRVIRVTWAQLAREPHAVVARLAQALVR